MPHFALSSPIGLDYYTIVAPSTAQRGYVCCSAVAKNRVRSALHRAMLDISTFLRNNLTIRTLVATMLQFCLFTIALYTGNIYD